MAMSIPPKFLDEIRARLTLSEVIGRRIKVTRAGREYKACCPFHKEKTPSFTINDDKGFYHCFGCGAHGDVLNFVIEHDNLPFPEAVEMLAAQAGLQVPKQSPQQARQARQEKDLYGLMQDAANWFEAQLHDPKNREVLDYILKRGTHLETIQAFSLGYAPDDYSALREHLLKLGYTDRQLQEVALTKASTKGKDPYVFFRGRIMFPVKDRRGRIVAFGGRILPEHMRPPSTSGYEPAKYMNSPETPIFHKGMMLYGEQFARQAAAEGQKLLVVEGYFDVIACYQSGFKGAVAPMGTALTEDQITLLWKMIPEENKIPYLCFDGDNAGRRAAERAIDRIIPLLSAGQSAQIVFLPEGEDPDSLLASGGRAGLEKVLNAALSTVEFLWQVHTAGRNFDAPEARAALVKTLDNEIKKISDRDVQIHYNAVIRQKISDAFFGGAKRKNQKRDNKFTPRGSTGLRRPSMVNQDVFAKVLLAAVLNNPAIYERIEEQFGEFFIASDVLCAVRERVISLLNDDPGLDRTALQRQIVSYGFEKDLAGLLTSTVYVHGSFCKPHDDDADSYELARQWIEFYDAVKDKQVEREIQNGWKQVLASSDADEEEKLKHLMLSRLQGRQSQN